MLKLFYSPGAISLAAHIVLEEADAPYELIRVDFKSKEQRSSEYLAINPQGRVPALVTSRGILTETPAILVHIAQSFPAARLLPPDPWDFARMLSVLSYVASTVHVDNAHLNRGYRWADDEEAIREMRRKAPEVMAADLRLLEEKIGEPWVLGEHYSVADAHLFVMSWWAEPDLFVMSWWAEPDGISLADLPSLRAHLDRMQNRPAVRKVLALEGLVARQGFRSFVPVRFPPARRPPSMR